MTISLQLIVNAAIIALVVYLVDRFVSVKGGTKALVIGVLSALALVFVPRFIA
jgi:hypothetical protein